MVDFLQTGITGLRTAQRGLATTSHNISNVNTEGYSRQRVEQNTHIPEYTGRGAIGRGSEVETIQRMSEETRVEALREHHAEFERLDVLQEMTGRLDNLVADKDAGLSPALRKFSNAVEEVANDPANTTTRQQMLTQGSALVDRFGTMDERMLRLQDDVQKRMALNVEQVNGLANSIAELNQEIRRRWHNEQHPPNDLLDQRDEKIRQLSELVGVRVSEQDDGMLNVGIGNGQPLVTGAQTNELKVTKSPYNPERLDLTLEVGERQLAMSEAIQGGALGGLMEFRDEVLNGVRDEIGRVATSLAVALNEQHNRGVHFDQGDPRAGDDFFEYASVGVAVHDGNRGSASPEVQIDRERIGQLKGDNYRLRYNGDAGQWRLDNLSTGGSQVLGEDLEADEDGRYRFDGLVLQLPNAGEVQDGDSFQITPTREGAREIEVRLSRPTQVAAAAPVTTGEALGERGQSDNTGDGRIGRPEVGDPEGVMAALRDGGVLARGSAVVLEYAEGPPAGEEARREATARPHFEVKVEGEEEPRGYLAYNPEDPARGQVYNLEEDGNIEGLDIDVRLSGDPDPGDRFQIAGNHEGVGDNTNALRMAELMDEQVMDNGNSSFQEAYSSMAGELGGQTQRVQTNRDAQETLLNQAQEQWESVSGVNLDEEAANMMEYQQAYQAAAQIISTADEVFQEILGTVRR